MIIVPGTGGGGSGTQNGRFLSKITLRLKKLCYKVSLWENCQPQICKAFIGLNILPEILDQSDRIGSKSPIFDLFSLLAPRAVTPSEKSSINANRKSTTRFPMSLRWSSYVAPQKRKTADFR